MSDGNVDVRIDPVEPSERAALLLGTGEYPNRQGARGAGPEDLLDTDAVRAALGRIACMYDGGHLLE